ncbi:Quino protein alcohol dehydrogenase-like protein [Coniochaeta hoffmannii]|uniref:Quino protein alcohol dehydrogenase-like protein n=1 Tax=Coniochaeta hoffmannii TaxID=91930 RepID=A0AA38RJE6_9PEZI|nr:Quino protein alcohol dehydrogenase-like protein [Coniochaeta hoffmannii]
MRSLITAYLFSAVHVAVILPSALATSHGYTTTRDEWTGWGGSIYNNRASSNKLVTSSTLKNVSVHCQIPHPHGVSATPVLSRGIAYYPTWGGTFVALDYDKCQIKWEINVTSIIVNFAAPTPLQLQLINAPLSGGLFSSRTSPQIDTRTNVLYFATQLNALVVAADVDTGSLLGVKQINPHPAAVVTLSPTLHENILYVGAASGEELAAGSVPGYQCCSFVGNAAALTFDRNSRRFNTVWNLDMLPPPPADSAAGFGNRWSGVGVWGSQPAIDAARNRVLFATGNVYSAPDAYLNCTDEAFTPSTTQNATCLPDRVWQNAVLAVELVSGKVAWITRFGPLDVWNLACGINGAVTDPVSCPGTPGPDYDFGMAPSFVPAKGQNGVDVVTVGQKSGYLYGLAADTGEVRWATLTSPGGSTGGLSWGVAVDDRRIYFTGINSANKNWTLQPRSSIVANNSVWGAASVADGKLFWETQVSERMMSYTPPTVVGDVVLVGRVKPIGPISSGDGPLVVLDKETGRVLLEYPLNGTLRGGFAVQDRYILFGTGYKGSDGFLYVLKVSDHGGK